MKGSCCGRRLGFLRLPARLTTSGQCRWPLCGVYAAQQLLHRQQSLSVGHLQQSQLKMEPLLLAIAEFRVRAQHDLQMPRQVFFGKQFCYPRHAGALIG